MDQLLEALLGIIEGIKFNDNDDTREQFYWLLEQIINQNEKDKQVINDLQSDVKAYEEYEIKEHEDKNLLLQRIDEVEQELTKKEEHINSLNNLVNDGNIELEDAKRTHLALEQRLARYTQALDDQELDHTGELKAYEEKLSQLMKQLENSEKKLKQYEQDNKQYIEQIDKDASAKAQLEKKLNENNKKIDDLTNKLKTGNNDLDLVSKANDKLWQEHEEVLKHNENYKENIDSLQKAISSLQGKMNDQSQKFKKQEEIYRQERLGYEKGIGEFKFQLNVKNQELEKAREEIKLLTKQQVTKLPSLEDELKEILLRENLETAKEDIERQTQLIADLKKELQEKEISYKQSLEEKEEIKKLSKETEEKVTLLDQKNDQLLKSKTELEQTLEKLKKSNETLVAKHNDDQEIISTLQNDIEENNKLISSLEEQLQQEKLNLKNLTGEKEQLQQEKLELTNKFNEAQNSLEQLEIQLKEKETEFTRNKQLQEKAIEENNKLISSLEEQLQQEKLNLKNLTGEKEQLQQEKLELTNKFNEAQNSLEQLEIQLKEKESQHLKDTKEIAKLSKEVAEKAILIEQLQKRLREGFTQLKMEKSSDYQIINKISENISEQHLNFNPEDKHDPKIDHVIHEEILGTNKLPLSKKNLSLFLDSKKDPNPTETLKIQQACFVEILPSHTQNAATQTLGNAHKNTYQQNADKKFIDWQNIVQLIRRIDGETKVEGNSEALRQCIAQQKIDFRQQDKSFTLSQNKSTNAITLESHQASFDHFVETLSKLINEQRKVKPDKTIHIAFKKIPDLNKEEYQKALQTLSQYQNIKINYEGDNQIFAEALKQSKAEPDDALKLFDKQENHYGTEKSNLI
jgi:chromosome segregation ATPase